MIIYEEKKEGHFLRNYYCENFFTNRPCKWKV